jgi:oligopeptide/dipeptide ABC transporter ATP-binding protein
MTVLLEAAGLQKDYRLGRGRMLRAVAGVDFTIARGEVVGLVGESGSGKSTIGRILTRLTPPSAGRLHFGGADLLALPAREMRAVRARLQIVFQDPWASLNPRLRVRRLIEEPLLLHSPLGAAERRAAAERLAARVRLGAAALDRYPVDLSGGQLQRVCIARALATGPELLVLDEPTSSLDLSVRAGILDLLHGLRAETGMAMLFISHDLATVRLLCDRVLVLYLGRVVEEGPAAAIFAAPRHPYTQALLSAQLSPDPRIRGQRLPLTGDIPGAAEPPTGCGFAGRCPHAADACRSAPPPLVEAAPGQRAACIRTAEIQPSGSAAGSSP